MGRFVERHVQCGRQQVPGRISGLKHRHIGVFSVPRFRACRYCRNLSILQGGSQFFPAVSQLPDMRKNGVTLSKSPLPVRHREQFPVIHQDLSIQRDCRHRGSVIAGVKADHNRLSFAFPHACASCSRRIVPRMPFTKALSSGSENRSVSSIASAMETLPGTSSA